MGVPGQPLAHLASQYGAPLLGRLCRMCGRVWLSLHADDAKGRQELAARFGDSGACGRCGRGRVRVTRVDVPHAGSGVLYDPALPHGPHGWPTSAADLFVAVCDSCGEAEARAAWPEPTQYAADKDHA
jgi:hypothetical protein